MVKLKFQVVGTAESENFDGTRIHLKPIPVSNNAEVNYILSKDSSLGLIELFITDPIEANFFQPGKRCLITFTTD